MTANKVVAGIGFSRAAEAAEIVDLIEQALTQAGLSQADLAAIAVPDFKRGTDAADEAAKRLDAPLKHALKQDMDDMQMFCVTRSEHAADTVGVASVAEGAALAGAGPGARLILPRIKSAHVTCALAAEKGDGV